MFHVMYEYAKHLTELKKFQFAFNHYRNLDDLDKNYPAKFPVMYSYESCTGEKFLDNHVTEYTGYPVEFKRI